MKLLIIVLCLLSERYLVHVSSHRRFHWFSQYANWIEQHLSRMSILSTAWSKLLFSVLPILLIVFVILHVLGHRLFGMVGLLLHVVIFYYCIGPANPFYPKIKSKKAHPSLSDVGTYFVDVNGQLFAGIFWYIFLGPIALLAYRLVSLCQSRPLVMKEATILTNILDWIPARITALLYLLVGHFQAGFKCYTELFLARPDHNAKLLKECGIKAVASDGEPLTLPLVETHMEHAMIACLALVAIFTLASWM